VAYIGACIKVNLAALLNGTGCIVSSTNNRISIIVIKSTCRSIGSHRTKCQLWNAVLAQKQLLYALGVV